MDMDFCRRMVERCVPGMHVRKTMPVLSNRKSLTLEINEEYTCRFPQHPDLAARLGPEIMLLPELARELPVQVPRIAYVCHGDHYGDGVTTFVIYRRIPGVALSPSYLRSAESEKAIAGQLAAILNALHHFPLGRAMRCGMENDGPGAWRRRYEELYKRIERQVFPLLRPTTRAHASALWAGFLSHEANFCFRPSLIHADLRAGHILYDPPRGMITGITDWADTMIGDPAMDLGGLLRDYGPILAGGVLERYEGSVDSSLWERMIFYSRMDPFREIQAALVTGEEGLLRYGLECLEDNLQLAATA